MARKKKKKEGSSSRNSAQGCSQLQKHPLQTQLYIKQTGEVMLDNTSWSKNLIKSPKLRQGFRLAAKPASMYHGRLYASKTDFISG